jgi:hypothetical protein
MNWDHGTTPTLDAHTFVSDPEDPEVCAQLDSIRNDVVVTCGASRKDHR